MKSQSDIQWPEYTVPQLFEKLPVGKRYDQKSVFSEGAVPVIDQGRSGVIGYHNDEPGIRASVKSPVVTFANHTCQISLQTRDFSVIQNVFPLKARDGFDIRFLYYLTKDSIHFSEYKGHWPDFERLRFKVPPKEIQVQIVKILGDLDRKIELNRQMNQTLEQIGQTLFKHYFIDNPERESWNEVSLSDIIEFVKEPVISSKVPLDSIYLPIEKLSMKSFSVVGPAPLDDAKSSLVAFQKNDILLGAMRVYFHRVNIAPADGVTRSTVFVLRTKDIKNHSFVCYLLNQESTIEYARMTSKGSTMPYAVWTNGLADMKFRLPPENLIAEFNEVVKPILETIRDSYKKNVTLTQVRDFLLPKLISGQIEV